MYGDDRQLMSGIITGAVGGVGTTYSHMPRLIQRLLKNTSGGKIIEARRDQLRVQQFARAREKYDEICGNSVASSKAIMGMIGLDLGPSRSPYSAPTDDVRDNLRKDLEIIGFFDWRE